MESKYWSMLVYGPLTSGKSFVLPMLLLAIAYRDSFFSRPPYSLSNNIAGIPFEISSLLVLAWFIRRPRHFLGHACL